MSVKKKIEVDINRVITAMRFEGFAIPDSAEVKGVVGDKLVFEFDSDSIKRFKVIHYVIKGYRDAQETTEEVGDWQQPEIGTFTRVLEAQNAREANAIAGPYPAF